MPANRGVSAWRLVLAIALTASLAVAEDDRGFEIGILGGFVQPGEELAGTDSPDLEPTLGFRTGYVFHRRIGWFLDGLYAGVDTETFAGDAKMITIRTGGDVLFQPGRNNHWFISLGGGYMDIRFDNATDFNSAFASAGFGQRIWISGRKFYRWEVRVDHTLADAGLRGEDLTQPQFLLGMQWGPGRRPQDLDGDGLVSRHDQCPGTPAGATVDGEGCPHDGDGDGVYDGIDRCPDTPPGVDVGADGCAPDTDGDGVPDRDDACAGTPTGGVIDATGCIPDQDGDGVPDHLDYCSDTPEGVRVSASGCPRDSDGDGVYDGPDACPDTPRGTVVDETGCPPD